MYSGISWNEAKSLFNKVQHVSIATVDEDGVPRVSPIGSVFLTDKGRGYYFEKFPRKLRENLERGSGLSLLAVHPGPGFWLNALWKGKFNSQPAIRLVCKAGKRRVATQEEIDGWLAKVRPYRFFKGHAILWKDMSHIREFTVQRVEPVEMGSMTAMQNAENPIMAVESIAALMNGADHFDSRTFTSRRDMQDFLTRMLGYKPAWLEGLYKVRGIVAKVLGLKHDEIEAECLEPSAYDFNPGGKVDFFRSLYFDEGKYWIGEASDRHLSGYIGVVAEPGENASNRFHVITIVHYRHWTGPLYFNLIRPFHHIIVYFMGKHAAS